MELTINLSAETIRILDELVKRGIYGATQAEVAARLIERRLQELVEQGIVKLRTPLMRGARDGRNEKIV